MNDKTGIVLIHGAGLGTFIWDDMKPLLHFPVLAIAYPNREVGDQSNINLTFDDYIISAIGQIQTWDVKKFVIVTHSIGGCLGLALADHFPDRIIGFVGISSAIPKNGQSFISILPFPQRLIMPLILKFFGTKPPQKLIEQELCNDLTKEQSLEIVKRFTPESKLLYTSRISYQKLKVKTLYIKLTNDQSIPVALQDRMIKNLNATEVRILESGHLPMISKPKEIAELLNRFTATIIKKIID